MPEADPGGTEGGDGTDSHDESGAPRDSQGGGGAEGLRNALVIVCFAGFAAAFVDWLGSRTYPADVLKVRAATLEAE